MPSARSAASDAAMPSRSAGDALLVAVPFLLPPFLIVTGLRSCTRSTSLAIVQDIFLGASRQPCSRSSRSRRCSRARPRGRDPGAVGDRGRAQWGDDRHWTGDRLAVPTTAPALCTTAAGSHALAQRAQPPLPADRRRSQSLRVDRVRRMHHSRRSASSSFRRARSRLARGLRSFRSCTPSRSGGDRAAFLVSLAPGLWRTVRHESHVILRITNVMTSPMIGSPIGAPRATIIALRTTSRDTKPSTRAWLPSAIGAGLEIVGRAKSDLVPQSRFRRTRMPAKASTHR